MNNKKRKAPSPSEAKQNRTEKKTKTVTQGQEDKNNSENAVLTAEKCYYFACPHCRGGVEVEHNQVNCTIFRHGRYISSGQQVNPHASKEQCDNLKQTNKIWGCGKPFRLVKKNDGTHSFYIVMKCDYI